jgi:GT2 family glycosyltransferase
MADVRVGIVSWNTADLLDRCLAALPRALGDLEAEVVVVDNASSDHSADVAARHPGVEVHRNRDNIGYARAMNQALHGSAAPVLIALNPDTEPPEGSLRALVHTLRDRPDTALVVPRLLEPDGSLQHSVYRFPSTAVAAAVCFLPAGLHRGAIGRRFWLEGGAPHDRSGDIDWAIGAVHCMRAAAVGATPYRERWFMYVEDLDLCWRLRQAGWSVWFDADVAVPHVGNASGVQAWGESRTRRWLDATYDWYALVHGRWRARTWAAVNASGMALKVAWAGFGVSVGLPDRTRRRAWFVEARGWLRLHAPRVLHPTGSSSPAARSREEEPAAPAGSLRDGASNE